MEGRLTPASEKLKSSVRKARPETPRCFRWATVSLSSPTAIDGLASLIAGSTSRTLNGRKS